MFRSGELSAGKHGEQCRTRAALRDRSSSVVLFIELLEKIREDTLLILKETEEHCCKAVQMGAAAVVRVFFVLLCESFACTLAGKHSLSYLFMMPSKSNSSKFSDVSVVTLLDDRQIDFYSSTDGIRTARADEMKKISESDWKEGTKELKGLAHQLNDILENQIMRFINGAPDGHVLQWRITCEVEVNSDGSVSVINYIDEYGYDGQDLISYNWTSKTWSASLSQAKKMEEKWNAPDGGYAEKDFNVCVFWLKKYIQYNITETKLTPDVYVFANKLTLTCMATGFYPKDVEIKLRKSTTSLPEHLLTSSEITPNGDGTYQLRKSVDIQEDDTAKYDCYVNHSSLNRPVIKKWERPVAPSSPWGVIGGIIAGSAVIAGLIIYFILQKKIAGCVHFVIRRRCEPQMEAEHDAGDGGSRRGEEPREPNETTPILQRRDPSVRFSQLLERLTP